VLMHSNRLIISLAAETWTVHALHARDQPRRREDREECYLKWKCSGSWADSGLRWQSGVIPGVNAAVTVFFLLLAAFCYLCPSPSFVLFFPVYGLAVVEGGRGSGWEEKWWWFQAVARLSFLLLLCAEPAVPVFSSSLSVLSCFSSPSLVLLALAALMVAGWRCCGGSGEEAQRWCPGGEERSFFSSVQRPQSLFFPPHVCFRFLSSVSQINLPLPVSVRSLLSLCSPSLLQNFALPGVPLLLKKIVPLFPILPSFFL